MSLTKTAKISEANVSKAIQDLLAAKKIMHFRMNAGDRFGSTNGRKWRIRGHGAGTADLLALVKMTGVEKMLGYRPEHMIPLPVWIEVKAPGKKQSVEQVEFQAEVERYGMTYMLADNVDTVIDWLKARGI